MSEEQDKRIYLNMMANEQKSNMLSSIKDLVNADDIVSEVRFQLTGKKQVKHINPETKAPEIVEVRYHAPLVNDYGANKLIADFRAYINPNVVLSYLEKNDIRARSRSYFTNIVFELARNMVNYGIYSTENHAKIRTILGTNFHAALSRAYNGLTILTALKNISVQEVRQLEPEQAAIKKVFSR